MDVTREMVRKAAERVGRELGGTVTHQVTEAEAKAGHFADCRKSVVYTTRFCTYCGFDSQKEG